MIRPFLWSALVACSAYSASSVVRADPPSIDFASVPWLIKSRFEGQTLQQLAERLVGRTPSQRGDAASSEDYFCFRAISHGSTKYLLFASSRELAFGSRGGISRFEFAEHPPQGLGDEQCPLARPNAAIGLLLDFSEKDFAALHHADAIATERYRHSSCERKAVPEHDATYSYWRGRTDCFHKGESPFYFQCVEWSAEFFGDRLRWLTYGAVESIC